MFLKAEKNTQDYSDDFALAERIANSNLLKFRTLNSQQRRYSAGGGGNQAIETIITKH